MVFTKEDYNKIYQWIVYHSIKDTQFAEVILPLVGDELVAIVQNGINKKIRLKELRKTHTKLTQDEYLALAHTGKIDDSMTYVICSNDKSKIEKVYYGKLPYEPVKEPKTIKHISDWVIDETITTSTAQTIGYYGNQNISIKYSATRTITYEWSDGSPDTQEIEYGVITMTCSDSSVTITAGDDDAFTIAIGSNVGTGKAQKSIPISVNIHGNADDSDEQKTYTYNQNFATYTFTTTATIDYTARTYEMNLTASSSDGSLVFDSVSVDDDQVVTSATLSQVNTGVYKVSLVFVQNVTQSDRDVVVTVHSNVTGVSPQCTITQQKVSSFTVSIGTHTGLNMTRSANTVQYDGNVTITVTANTGYILPEDLEDFNITGTYTNASYSISGTTGTLSITGIKSNITVSASAQKATIGYYALLTSENSLPSIGTTSQQATAIAITDAVTEKVSETGKFVAVLVPGSGTPSVQFFIDIAQTWSSSANMLRPSDWDASFSDTKQINGVTYNIWYENDKMTSGQSKFKITIN